MLQRSLVSRQYRPCLEEMKEVQRQSRAAVCYFFLTGSMAGAVFATLVQDTPVTGGGIFLACLGFFVSRRCTWPFAIMFLLICQPRERPLYRAVWAPMTELSRFFSDPDRCDVCNECAQPGIGNARTTESPRDGGLSFHYTFKPSQSLVRIFQTRIFKL
jgi:hypothetical protein